MSSMKLNPEEDFKLVEMVSSADDSDKLICVKVGNVIIEMQIHSAVQLNIIDYKLWRYMGQHGVTIVSKLQIPDKKFKAYAQQDFLGVDLRFDAEIVIRDGPRKFKTISRFYVVISRPQPLLDKDTAKYLGVLRVSFPSQHEATQLVVTVEQFPSIRGMKIHIPIDKSVEPVTQLIPCHRFRLNGAVYFSLLDIKDAFYQPELDDRNKPMKTFIIHKSK